MSQAQGAPYTTLTSWRSLSGLRSELFPGAGMAKSGRKNRNHMGLRSSEMLSFSGCPSSPGLQLTGQL